MAGYGNCLQMLLSGTDLKSAVEVGLFHYRNSLCGRLAACSLSRILFLQAAAESIENKFLLVNVQDEAVVVFSQTETSVLHPRRHTLARTPLLQ